MRNIKVIWNRDSVNISVILFIKIQGKEKANNGEIELIRFNGCLSLFLFNNNNYIVILFSLYKDRHHSFRINSNISKRKYYYSQIAELCWPIYNHRCFESLMELQGYIRP